VDFDIVATVWYFCGFFLWGGGGILINFLRFLEIVLSNLTYKLSLPHRLGVLIIILVFYICLVSFVRSESRSIQSWGQLTDHRKYYYRHNPLTVMRTAKLKGEQICLRRHDAYECLRVLNYHKLATCTIKTKIQIFWSFHDICEKLNIKWTYINS
jgi:hypothetical protein